MRRSFRRIAALSGSRRRVLLAFIMLAAALFTFISFFFGLRSMAFAKESSEPQLYYMSYEVQEGDTLWEIAGEFNDFSVQSTMDYIRTVQDTNHILGDTIHAGQFIVIPYYK